MTWEIIKERLGITLRRVVAWWIDAFIAAAVIVVIRWAVNATLDDALTGRAGAYYDILALALIFYAYRVVCEATTRTSVGKWSLQLEIITERPGLATAALRNSWLLLTMLSATGLPFVEGLLLLTLGMSVLAVGQTPFDFLARCLVERKYKPAQAGPKAGI